MFDRCLSRVIVVLSFLMLSSVMLVSAQEVTQVEPTAGTWNHWVLASGNQLRLDAPEI